MEILIPNFLPSFIVLVGVIVWFYQKFSLWPSVRKQVFWISYWLILSGGSIQWIVLAPNKHQAITVILAILSLVWIITGAVQTPKGQPARLVHPLIWTGFAGFALTIILAITSGQDVSIPRCG